MKRRDVLVGAAVLPLAGVSGLAAAKTGDDHKDKYWDAQAHIDAVEQELSELRAHAQIMRKRMTNRVEFDADGTITVFDDDGVTPLVEGV